jgi:hypothetical protein
MTTIAMQTGLSGSGAVTVRGGGSQAYTLTNGLVQVAPVDVPAALASGWIFHGGSAAAYAAARARTMAPPSTYVGSTVTFPDLTTTTIASGVAQIPIMWAALFQSYGWTLAGAFSGS